MPELRREITDLKDLEGRQFNTFTENFYLIKAAVRYFAIKKNISFTAVKIADNFPMTIPSSGSCLNMLERLDVVKSRTKSSSPDRYMPGNVDMGRLNKVENILVENYEIERFETTKDRS